MVGRPRRVWSFIGVQAVRPGELQVALKREKRVVVGGGLEVEGWRVGGRSTRVREVRGRSRRLWSFVEV